MRPSEPVSPERHALLWFGGEPQDLAQWLAAGVVRAEVAAAGAWTLVRPVALPDGLGPYGDALGLVLSRPVPPELLPVVGMTEREGLLVVAAATAADPNPHWVAVRPGVGPHELADLPRCGPRFLAGAAGVPDRSGEVATLVSRGHGAGSTTTEFGSRLLDLPGASLIRTGELLPGGREVEPDPREVQRFRAVLADRLLERAEEEQA